MDTNHNTGADLKDDSGDDLDNDTDTTAPPLCSMCLTYDASCIWWNIACGTTGWACHSCRHDR